MKLTCTTKDLLKASTNAQRATKTKTTLAALSHLLIRPEEHGIDVIGSDTNCQIGFFCPADYDVEPKSFLIPSEMLVGLLKQTSAETVAMETLPNKVKITLDMAESVISTLDPQELPLFQGESIDEFDIDAQVLAKALKKVSFNTLEDMHDYKSAVHFMAGDGKLDIAASNGKSVAAISFVSSAKLEILVPRRLALLVASTLEQIQGNVTLAFGERLVWFSHPECQIIGKFQEGRFPPWKNAIPKEEMKSCIVDRSALIGALRTCDMFSTDVHFGVLLDFGQNLTISSRAPNNTHQDVISAIYPTPCEPMQIAIGHKMLMTALTKLDGEKVTLEFNSGRVPLMIREDNFLYLQQPLINQ